MSDLTGDGEDLAVTKIALRTRLITLRRELPLPERQTAATQLQDQILDLVRRAAPSTIAAYVPIGPEPGGADLPAVLSRQARLLLPVLRPDHDLDWAVADGSLASGPRGLIEPTGPRLGRDAIHHAGLILVPALAVDAEGRRMGRGGGSYDRVLARVLARMAGSPAPGPLVVALLHDWELIAKVPAEPHDRPVHGVVTPVRGFVPTSGFALSRASEWTK
jgi:5-formyltetrahydrofolate cyclo-ligase